jgi:Spy/CpxP family protein refolding chaperone
MVPKLGNSRTIIGACIALAFVALVSAALVFAQTQSPPASPMGRGMRGMCAMGQGPMRGMGGRGPMGRMMGPGGPMGLGIPLRQLGLTDAQREQIRKILESHRAEMQGLMKEAQPVQQALRTAIENNDANAIQAASTGLASELTKGALLRAKVHAEVFNVLTDEQKAKAKELGASAGQRGKGFPGMHQGPPLF